MHFGIHLASVVTGAIERLEQGPGTYPMQAAEAAV